MPDIRFRSLAETDFPLLLKWLEEPHVKAWWDKEVHWTEERVRQKYTSYTKGYKLDQDIKKPIHAYLVLIDEVPMAYVQFYNAWDFEPDVPLDAKALPQSLAALDFYIGEPGFLQKGFALLILQKFLQEKVKPFFAHCLVDPDIKNAAAIRAYEKAGFQIIESPSKNVCWMFADLCSTAEHEVQQQLQACLELLKTILGPDLLGVYLYGSSLVGGLQKYSDIDLFVVTRRTTTPEEKKKLIASLLEISGLYMKGPKRPLEVTIVERSEVNPWRYPPHFDFQYGEWLRDEFEKGVLEPSLTKEMPDLALIVTQVLLKSQTLLGPEPVQLLASIPYRDYIQVLIHDLDRLNADLEDDTRNILLTYARTWSTLATKEIRSKPAAADWVINHLPSVYQPVMKRAKSICLGLENEYWEDLKTFIKPCVAFMTDKIKVQIALIDFDEPNQAIKLAKQGVKEK